MSHDPLVIATFQPGKTVFRMVVFIAFLGALDAALIPGFSKSAWYEFFQQRAFLVTMPFVVWALSTIGLAFALTHVSRILFRGGSAVWIAKGNICYVSKYNFSVPLKDVSKISDGISDRTGNWCVFIWTKRGERKVIPTVLLADDSTDIVSRLMNALSQANET